MIGNHTRVKIVKNKVAPPFRVAEFDIMYGEGVSRVSSLLDMAVEMDIVNKSGAWFSYGAVRLGQGKENAKQTINETPGMADELEEKIRAKIAEEEGAGPLIVGQDNDTAEEAESAAEPTEDELIDKIIKDADVDEA